MSRLPPGVHRKHGSLYLVRRNKWTRLCREDEGESAMFRALASLSDSTPDRLALLFPLYLAEAEIRPPTHREYARALNGILLHRFGHMRPDDVTPAHIAQYLELRKREGAPTGGNRERAALSSVFEFAMRKGWATRNPCRGVRRNRERPSRTLVTDAQLRDAMDRSPPHFQLVLGVAYLTGLRMTDLVLLTRDQVKADGIHVTESKTGKRNLIAWSPALRELVTRALEHSKCERVLTGRYGQRLTAEGIASNMKRLEVAWSFRDLRPKAASDADHDVIGHRGQMLAVYQRARRLRPVR